MTDPIHEVVATMTTEVTMLLAWHALVSALDPGERFLAHDADRPVPEGTRWEALWPSERFDLAVPYREDLRRWVPGVVLGHKTGMTLALLAEWARETHRMGALPTVGALVERYGSVLVAALTTVVVRSEDSGAGKILKLPMDLWSRAG